MKRVFRFVAAYSLVVFLSGFVAVSQERNVESTLDQLQIDGDAVVASDIEGVLAAISRRYDVKIAVFSSHAEVKGSEGVIKVGEHLAYFPGRPKLSPNSGSLRSVLDELLPPHYRWSLGSNILRVTSIGNVPPDIEKFLATSILVPEEIEPCRKCTVTKSIWIDEHELDELASFVSEVLSVYQDSEIQGASNHFRLTTIGAFLIELLDKRKYRFIRVESIVSGRPGLHLTFEE